MSLVEGQQAKAAAGLIVGGKYRLIEPIGSGGMAVVWRAEELRRTAGRQRVVAIKKLNAGLRADRQYVAMFMEEARVGTQLRHPNIVEVYDFCQANDGLCCLVMEWVDGIDLRVLVETARSRSHRLPWLLVTAIGARTLRGLAAAHERRTLAGAPVPVIHRDVSPPNILLGLDGQVKLADFGLARARDRQECLTAPGTLKGKLRYMAPELTRGEPASVASDLFSLGCVLWEALAGRPLWDGEPLGELFRSVQRGQVMPLSQVRGDLPSDLIAAIHKALAFHPKDRFRTAREMARILGGLVVSSRVDVNGLLARAVREARASVPAAGRATGVDRSGSSEILELSSVDMEPG